MKITIKTVKAVGILGVIGILLYSPMLFAQDITITGKFIDITPTGAGPWIGSDGVARYEYTITMEVNVDGTIVTWSKPFWMTYNEYIELKNLNHKNKYVTITYRWETGHRVYKGFIYASKGAPYKIQAGYLYEVSPTGILKKIDESPWY